MKPYPLHIMREIQNLKELDTMRSLLSSEFSKDLRDFKIGSKIIAWNKMDTTPYEYELTAPYGVIDNEDFKPYFTPEEMLTMGVFEGKYLNDCLLEFPKQWFFEPLRKNKLSPGKAEVQCNYFKVKSRLSLEHWIKKGWIGFNREDKDNRGWFQWYCRYYIGRRIPSVDAWQIKRWRSFIRHIAQVEKNCHSIDQRPRQRQAILQWSHNCFIGCKN